jgi:5-methylcytosine-specific restriction endonuclease McrA
MKLRAGDAEKMDRAKRVEQQSTTLNEISPEVRLLIERAYKGTFPKKATIKRAKQQRWLGIEEAQEKKRAARRARKDKRKEARQYAPSPDHKDTFYKSWEWRTLRVKVLQAQGRECKCCGAKPGQLTEGGEPVRLVVDHIKPLATHWHLRLTARNLQVLCDTCNQGKGAWDQTDYRA